MGNNCRGLSMCLACFAYILMFVDSGSGIEPNWQILTRSNFSTQIHQHEHVLVMVTVPWSGESRALRSDIVQLMQHTDGQFEGLRLMLMYRNVEKMLGDVLIRSRKVTLVFYRQAVPYKYSGKLSAQNILASVWHAITTLPADLPLKRLDTLVDLDSFLQSTDKAVVLFEFCGWAEKILATKRKKTRFSAVEKMKNYLEETLERDDMGSFAWDSTLGSQLKVSKNNTKEAIRANYARTNRNRERLPKSTSSLAPKHLLASKQGICEDGEGTAASLWKDGFCWASYGNDSIETATDIPGVSSWKGNDHPTSKYKDGLFNGSSCTLDEYNYFEILFSNLTRIARDNMLPPERQRFGLLSNRTAISALGLQSQHAWSLMLQFPECPNCSKIFNRQNDLEEFVLMSQALVTELEGEGYKLAPPLSTDTPSLILFIDRASPSVNLKKRSKEALQVLRQVALHYVLSYQPDKSINTMTDKILSKRSLDRKDKTKSVSTEFSSINHLQTQVLQSYEFSKLMTSEGSLVIQLKPTENEYEVADFKRDDDLLTGSAKELLDYLRQKKSSVQLKEDTLSLIAKKAGLQLFSSDFLIDKVKLLQIPENSSPSIAEGDEQTEVFEGSTQSIDSESYQNVGNSPYITDNVPERPSSTHEDEKQISEVGRIDINCNDNQKAYDSVKYGCIVGQDSSVGEGQQQCSNKLSTIEALDRGHDKEACKSEMIESSGDQFSDMNGKTDVESVVGEYLLQKSDIQDDKEIQLEIRNVEENLGEIQGDFIRQQERTTADSGDRAFFEKRSEDSDKQDMKDQNYNAEKHSQDSDKWEDQQDQSYATVKHGGDSDKLEDEQDHYYASERQRRDPDKLEEEQDQDYVANISFFFSDGGDQLRQILSSDSIIPLVVIIDPINHVHYVFPRDTPVTHYSLLDFVNSFLSGTLQAHKHSEPLPQSPRGPPRPPFVNRDFHEVDSIPRVTVDTFSRLVLGFDSCNENVDSSCANSHHSEAAWSKDVLVLFSNNWCGFCMRLDLVVREVHRVFKQCADVFNAKTKVASDSSVQDVLPFSTETSRGKSLGDLSKDEIMNALPSIFRMDCTLNDCRLLLRSFNQRELYPVLLLFPAGKKDAPVAYEGVMSVNKIIEFLAAHGSISSSLYDLKGVLWNKKPVDRGSLNICTPRPPSATLLQFQSPLQVERPSHGLLLDALEQTRGKQIQMSNNGKSGSLGRASQKPTVGSVLIATEKLQGIPPFENSIILIVKVDPKDGFQGLIVNKPLSWAALPKMDMQLRPALRSASVWFGGPLIIKDMPFLSMTHLSNLEGFLEVIPGIYFGGPSVTNGIFGMIKSGNVSAEEFWFFWGFASWGWQQLFDELAEQAWRIDTYSEDVVRWPMHR